MLSRKINLGRYGVWQFFGLVSKDWDDAIRGTLRGGSSLSIYMSIDETYLSPK